MKSLNVIKLSVVALAQLAAGVTLRANPYFDLPDIGFYVEGEITSYGIQGAPDLGIAAGNHFTGNFRYWDGHSGVYGGSATYDGFKATINVNGITFRNTAGYAGITGGDFFLGGGPAEIISPNVDYSPFFSFMSLDTLQIFGPHPDRQFRFDASGGPSLLSPNGSALQIFGRIDSIVYFDFATVPDTVRTDALLVLAGAAFLVANGLVKRRLTVAR